jgi:glycosyltransferase involved in cell wall biosynthesis
VKIAIATDWFAPRLGGIESQLAQLAEGLASRGHDVDVLTTTPGARAGAGVGLRRLDVPLLPRLDLAMSPRLFASLRAELARGYDVVHAHVSVVSPVGYAAAWMAHRLGLPSVVTFHSVLQAKRGLLRAADAIGGIARSGVTWTAVSALVASQASGALRADVAVLPNGIDLAAWKRRPDESARLDDGRPVTFVSTMRLHRKKRPMQLLAAFARAAARLDRPVRLVVVGVGPLLGALKDAMRRAERANARIECELLGRLSAAELRALYTRSDAFVLASRRESFGIAALEASAAGLPVIGMRAAGSGEFLTHGDNALLCDDDRDLAEAIARLAGDSALRRNLARPAPLERYDWGNVLAEHESTYRRAAATRRSPAPDPAVAPTTSRSR